MFYFGLVAVELIPLLVLLAAWYFWRRKQQEHSGATWRKNVMFAGFVGVVINLAMAYSEAIYEYNFGNRNWTFYGYLSEVGFLLCVFSVVASALGVGNGRMLLALAGLLSFGLWMLLTGPVWI